MSPLSSFLGTWLWSSLTFKKPSMPAPSYHTSLHKHISELFSTWRLICQQPYRAHQRQQTHRCTSFTIVNFMKLPFFSPPIDVAGKQWRRRSWSASDKHRYLDKCDLECTDQGLHLHLLSEARWHKRCVEFIPHKYLLNVERVRGRDRLLIFIISCPPTITSLSKFTVNRVNNISNYKW